MLLSRDTFSFASRSAEDRSCVSNEDGYVDESGRDGHLAQTISQLIITVQHLDRYLRSTAGGYGGRYWTKE